MNIDEKYLFLSYITRNLKQVVNKNGNCCMHLIFEDNSPKQDLNKEQNRLYQWQSEHCQCSVVKISWNLYLLATPDPK